MCVYVVPHYTLHTIHYRNTVHTNKVNTTQYTLQTNCQKKPVTQNTLTTQYTVHTTDYTVRTYLGAYYTVHSTQYPSYTVHSTHVSARYQRVFPFSGNIK